MAAVDSEPNAEIIAGRLRAEGIAVRVRYDSQAGIPPQIAPAGLGFGPGAFRVSVGASDAALAREILGEAEPAARRGRPVVRIISTILLVLVLLGFLQSALQLVPLLFRR